MASRYFGVAKEANYGVFVSPTRYIQIVSESMKPDNKVLYPETIEARDFTSQAAGPYGLAGTIECLVSPENLGELLRALFGKAPSTTNPYAGVYRHKFTGADSLSSVSMEIGLDAITARRIQGGIIDSLTLECASKEYLSASLDCIGQKDILAALGSPTWPTLPFFTWAQAVATRDTVDLSAAVEAFSLTIANNVYDDIQSFNSRFLPRIENARRDINGSFDLAFLNTDDYKKFFGAAAVTEPQAVLTPVALNMKFTGAIIASTYPYYIEIDLPKVVYDTLGGPFLDRRERLIQPVDFHALYDASSAYAVAITLQNTIASYS